MLQRIWAITEKELIQTLRDRTTLIIMLIVPFIQIIMFGTAIHMDVTHIPMVVADQSLDSVSRGYINAMVRTNYFDVVANVSGAKEMQAAIDSGVARIGLLIPPGFAASTNRGDASVQILVDGSDSFTTQSAYNNASIISQQYAVNLKMQKLSEMGQLGAVSQQAALTPHLRILYNPDLKDLWVIIPGIVATILSTQTVALTALAVVREREVGTIEALLVSPIHPIELMIGKMAPNLLIATFNVLTVVFTGSLVFNVPFMGNFPVFMLVALFFSFGGLGLGLVISALSESQVQAMQLTMMLSFTALFLSGFMFPHYSLPELLKMVSYIFPLTYFIPVARGIFTKGIEIQYMIGNTIALVGFTIIILVVATRMFRQRLD
jgi:ABC-2 type transport system permease protein